MAFKTGCGYQYINYDDPRCKLGVAKILNIGLFTMQPKIVVMLVLGTQEHLGLFSCPEQLNR